MRVPVAIVVGVVLCLAAGAGRADPDPGAARAHHAAAKQAYLAGDYDAALREWTAAYQAAPARGTLVNLGQVYRRLEDLAKAREFYLRYLAEAPPDEGAACAAAAACSAELVCQGAAQGGATCVDPLRAQVVELIAEIDRAEAAGALATKPSVPPPDVAARQIDAAATEPTRVPPGDGPRPRRRWWLWGTVGAVALAAVVTTIVVVAGSDPVACSAAELGCVDRR